MGDSGVIYAITCVASGRRYIGSSVNYSARRRQHLHQLRRGTHHSRFMQREYNKRGEQLFSFAVLLDGISAVDLPKVESDFIRQMRPEYNGAQPGASRLGSKQSDQCKAKVSAANKGRRHTDEAKAKIGAASKGNKHAVGNTNRLKVTAAMREEILSLRNLGMGCRRLAAKFGVDKKTIHNVYHNKYKSEV